MVAEVITLRSHISMGRRSRGCQSTVGRCSKQNSLCFHHNKKYVARHQPHFHVHDTAWYPAGCQHRIIRWKVNIELCVISKNDVVANNMFREDI